MHFRLAWVYKTFLSFSNLKHSKSLALMAARKLTNDAILRNKFFNCVWKTFLIFAWWRMGEDVRWICHIKKTILKILQNNRTNIPNKKWAYIPIRFFFICFNSKNNLLKRNSANDNYLHYKLNTAYLLFRKNNEGLFYLHSINSSNSFIKIVSFCAYTS